MKSVAGARHFQHPHLLTDAWRAGTMGMMQLPAYFWQTTDHCPKFSMPQVDFAESFFKPIPGIKLTRDHPPVIG